MRLLAFAAVVSLVACKEPPPPPPPTPAQPAAPEPLAVYLTDAASLDGGMLQLSEQHEQGIPPNRPLELTANRPLHHARVRLFDRRDRVVPSRDTQQSAVTGFRYTLRPTEPLKTGEAFWLTVDDERGVALEGTDRLELRFKLLIAEPLREDAGVQAAPTR